VNGPAISSHVRLRPLRKSQSANDRKATKVTENGSFASRATNRRLGYA